MWAIWLLMIALFFIDLPSVPCCGEGSLKSQGPKAYVDTVAGGGGVLPLSVVLLHALKRPVKDFEKMGIARKPTEGERLHS